MLRRRRAARLAAVGVVAHSAGKAGANPAASRCQRGGGLPGPGLRTSRRPTEWFLRVPTPRDRHSLRGRVSPQTQPFS